MDQSKKAFTLIELLVVIAIISLLLSIMVPSLRKAKQMAKSAVCKTRVRQWAPIFEMFTMDNNDCFPSWDYETGTKGSNGHWWMQPLRDYYQDPEIRLCPCATKVPDYIAASAASGTIAYKDYAWASNNPYPELEPSYYIDSQECILGSLGPNGYAMDYRGSESASVSWGQRGNHWDKKSNVKDTHITPLFGDCYWVDGFCEDYDTPQDEDYFESSSTNELRRYNLARHGHCTNICFMDGSVDNITLPELWTLKWHKSFNTQANSDYDWPDWMTSLSN